MNMDSCILCFYCVFTILQQKVHTLVSSLDCRGIRRSIMGNTKSSSDAACVNLITPKGIIRFFCLFQLVFGLLMASWPRLGRAYTRLYSTGADCLFGSVGITGIVRFEPLSDSEYDLHVTLYNRASAGPDGGIARIQTHHNSRHAGYIYVAFLTALILATPILWKRKGWALFWGIILIH